jgi:hypothetical protein
MLILCDESEDKNKQMFFVTVFSDKHSAVKKSMVFSGV